MTGALARVAALAAVVLAVTAAEASAVTAFVSPSGAIGCQYTPAPDGGRAQGRGDQRPVDRPARRPSSCRGAYGTAFGLSATGRGRRLCVGDTVLGQGGRVLRYDRRYRFGPFTCRTSERRGMRCTNRNGGGFELSRQRQRLF